ncbi:MAG: type II secretion system F family protein [Actinomycetota bacterium]|nr:type II secretion system F family protein [Actinomycetota bacterium]
MTSQLLLGGLLLAGAAGLTWRAMRPGTAANAAVDAPAATDLRDLQMAAPATERLLRPGADAIVRRLHRLAPASARAGLATKIATSGLTGRVDVDQLVGLKIIGTVLGTALGVLFFASVGGLLGLVLAAVFVAGGWKGVDLVLAHRTDARREAIADDLPDVLDQLAIAVGAGLGLEAAMLRVSRTHDGPLADDIGRAIQDVRLGSSRREALDRLAERGGHRDVRRFVRALRQAETTGAPLTKVLKTQAAEHREKRRQRAEERAMGLPVKMIFPLVATILPALFIVILGPAVLRLAEAGLA